MGTISMKRLWDVFLSNSILKFVVTGGCSTGVDFIIYMLLSLRLPIIVSKGISMVAASVFSYIVNKRFTFENKEKTNAGYLFRFYMVFAVNLGTNLGANQFVFDKTGDKLIAFVLATLCGMTINYIGQRFLVFDKRR